MHKHISFQSTFNSLSAGNNRGTICLDSGLPPNQSSQGATNLEMTKTTVIWVSKQCCTLNTFFSNRVVETQIPMIAGCHLQLFSVAFEAFNRPPTIKVLESLSTDTKSRVTTHWRVLDYLCKQTLFTYIIPNKCLCQLDNNIRISSYIVYIFVPNHWYILSDSIR